jgi:Tol biopolymer transport system component/DNA-binding winged helix-turn-helix (wHTH) protein
MTESSGTESPRVRFGPFDADLQTQELRKHGVRLRLPGQSFQVLKMLLERPGGLVTPEDFRNALWPSDTFVDFDHGLSAAVNRLREALGDSADSPRLIETLPRRGYRFIGQVDAPPPVPTSDAVPAANTAPQGRTKATIPSKLLAVSLITLVCLLASVLVYFRPRDGAAIEALAAVPFTALPGLEVAPSLAPDGSQIVFAWSPSSSDAASDGLGFDLYAKSMGSEKLRRLTNHPSQWISSAWSPDGKQIAFHRVAKEGSGLFVIPSEGGSERKLRGSNISLPGASRISWSPDGKSLAFADSPATGGHRRLYLLRPGTDESMQIEHNEECQEETVPAFSPDGKHLAYLCFLSSGEYAVAVATSSGNTPRLIKKYRGWAWGLAWTVDSERLILCQFQMGDARNSLFELTLAGTAVRPVWFGKDENPEWPVISAKGNRIAYDNLSGGDPIILRRDLQNPQAPAVKLITSSRAQLQPVYSPDGKHIAFGSNRGGAFEIWMTDSDGNNPVQLTNLKGSGTPNWSPDGQKVVFDSRFDGHAGVYIVDISERVPRKLVTNLADVSVPSWSHDGKWIYFIGGGSGHAERIYRAPANGGDATPLSTLRGYGPMESFDGEHVYFTTSVTATDNVVIVRASQRPEAREDDAHRNNLI